MRTLKNLALFVAGGVSFAFLYAYGALNRTEHPLEGAVVYEDDDIKVTRISQPNGDGYADFATISYKHD